MAILILECSQSTKNIRERFGLRLNYAIELGKMRMIADLFMTNKIAEILVICSIHLIWSDALGYYEPFPYRKRIAGQLMIFAVIIRFWYLMKREARV